jgi:hypothetical protein
MSLDEDLQPVDWSTIEDAIYDWLTGGVSGFDEIVPEAIWEDQNVAQPDYPYATMKMIAQSKEGGRDEIRTTTLVGQPLGREVEIMATGPIQMTISVSFNTDATTGGSSSGTRARSLAVKAQSSLGLPVVIDHLYGAGLSIIAEEGVSDTSLVINGEWLSRATLDVRFRTATQMTQRHGYIDKVHLESEDLDVDADLDVDTIVDGS